MSNLRDTLQEQFAGKAWKDMQGIVFVAPRVGKCRIGIKLMQKISEHPRVLIVYPDNKIKKSWEDELILMDYDSTYITFSSNISLHKNIEGIEWDLILLDECHQLSERNIRLLEQKCHQNTLGARSWIIGLSGSLSLDTEKELSKRLKMPVIVKYTQEEAIRDGIVTDYQINIVECPLDNTRKVQYKKKMKTEKEQFDAYSFIIRKLQYENKNYMFLALARMRIIQNSVAKMEMTRKLIKQFKHERLLVFCGLIKIADQLGIEVQHSESDDNLVKFQNGEIDKLAVVKMGNAGVTYKPLNKIIINYFNSSPETFVQQLNRATNMEFDNPDKIAQIYIVSTTEPVEKKWLNSAMETIPKEKIKYIKI